MMKKFVLLLTLLLAALFSTVAAQEETEINLSISCTCSDPLEQWFNEYVIPQFEERMQSEGKNINVELVDYDFSGEEYREQIAIEFGLNTGTDLAGFDGFWISEFVEAGLLRPLEEVVGSTVNDWDGWESIAPGTLGNGTFEGKLYSMPDGTDVRAIFYRRDLFEQAGIALPWTPTRWEDILDAARQLRASGIESPLQIDAGTFMGEAATMQGYFMLLLGAGSHVYDFEAQQWVIDESAILDVLNFYQTVYVDEALGNTELQLTATGRDNSFTAMQQGEIAIYIEGDYLWRSIMSPANASFGIENRNEIVDWTAMPAIEPGAGYNNQDFVTISGGSTWVINPNTEYPQESWALLTFLASQEALQARQAIEPRIPPRTDVVIEQDAVLEDMAETLLPLTTTRPLLPQYSLVSFEIQLMTERVITGEMTPDEALAAYKEAVIALVGEENIIIAP
jgi:multiple sugar transport system substrate-binding protein